MVHEQIGHSGLTLADAADYSLILCSENYLKILRVVKDIS